MQLPEGSAERLTRMDASSRSLFQQCPAKFYYRRACELVPLRDDDSGSWAMQFGSAIHKALEQESLVNAIATFHQEYDAIDLGPSQELVDAVRAETYANRQRAHIHAPDRGVMMLEGYWAKYESTIGEIEVLGKEMRLKMPFGEGRTYYGTLDRLARWEAFSEHPIVEDYKTTGSRAGASGMVTNPFPQQEGYVALAVENGYMGDVSEFGHGDPLMFIINILGKDDTLDGRNYKSGKMFERATEYRDTDQLAYWALETQHVWNDVMLCAERRWWPMAAPNACMAWGRACEYLDICKAPCDSREPMMDTEREDAQFMRSPWQPEEAFDFDA